MGAGPLAGRAYVRREFEGVAQVFVPGAEGSRRDYSAGRRPVTTLFRVER